MGTVIQISVSPGGLPKRAVREAFLGPLGFEGDGHAHPRIHGGPDKAVLVVTAETVDELAALGFPVYYGALGENLTVRGLDRQWFRSGQQYRVGLSVIEFTTVRIPCRQLDVYGPSMQREIWDAQVAAGDPASPHWGMSGFYGRVLTPGMVRTDDIIALVATLA
ncbi:MAG TPA: MOSC domain-containing protein [Bryobacteraceae bacterium]|nr:MOSC domain-containing protein [Bryobacteraceae bacterium]